MDTLREIITEHINYRRQIFQLAKTEIIKNNSGTALGWLWSFIRPAIFISIYYIAFNWGLRVGTAYGQYSYFQWMLAGLIPWFFIRDAFVSTAASIRMHRHLVTKIKFPISVIPTFVGMADLLVNLALTAMMLVYFILCGDGPDIYWLQLPLYTLLMFFFFSLWGIFASALSTMSKDFLMLIKSITIALFWLSGIIFDVSKVDNAIFQVVLKINPITVIVNGYRDALIHKQWFWERASDLGMFFLVSAVMMALAVFVYRKLRDDIPDVL